MIFLDENNLVTEVIVGIDENEKIYVVEGPIDSLFIENSIATADANLTAASEIFDKQKLTLIFDFQNVYYALMEYNNEYPSIGHKNNSFLASDASL